MDLYSDQALKLFLFLLLLLIPPQALAGATASVGSLPRPLWQHHVEAFSVVGIAYTKPYGVGSTGLVVDAADGRARGYIPEGHSLTITHIRGTLVENQGSTEQCHYTLAYSADGSGTAPGTDIVNSDFLTNEAFDCDGVPTTLTLKGQSCLRRVVPITLEAGAWVHWRMDQGTGASGETCANSDTYMEVLGTWDDDEDSGIQTDRFIYQWTALDTVMDGAGGALTSYCKAPSMASQATSRRCILPISMTARLVEFGLTLTEPMASADNEDCTFIVEVGAYADPSPTAIPSSSISVGEDVATVNAAGTCAVGTVVLDGMGEGCTRIIDANDANTVMTGGWWSVLATDAAGAGSCTSVDSVTFFTVWDRE